MFSDKFEEQSFRNLVHFYREELLTLMKGVNATNLWNPGTRRHLAKHGVTKRKWRGYGYKTILTTRALRILEEEA